MVQTADVRPFMRQHVRLLRPVEANRQIDARPQQAEHKRRGDAGRLIDAVFQAYGPCKAPPEPDQRDQSVQQHGQKTDKVQRRSDGNENLQRVCARLRRTRRQQAVDRAVERRNAGMDLRRFHQPDIERNRVGRERQRACRDFQRKRDKQPQQWQRPERIAIAPGRADKQRAARQHEQNCNPAADAHVYKLQKHSLPNARTRHVRASLSSISCRSSAMSASSRGRREANAATKRGSDPPKASSTNRSLWTARSSASLICARTRPPSF